VVNNTLMIQNHMDDRSEHNQKVNIRNFTAHESGARMNSQQQTQQQMMQAITEVIRGKQPAPAPVFSVYPKVVNVVSGPPPLPLEGGKAEQYV
jgi:hypothetical protein